MLSIRSIKHFIIGVATFFAAVIVAIYAPEFMPSGGSILVVSLYWMAVSVMVAVLFKMIDSGITQRSLAVTALTASALTLLSILIVSAIPWSDPKAAILPWFGSIGVSSVLAVWAGRRFGQPATK